MLLSKDSVKVRSLAVSSLVLAMTTALAGATTTGCFFFGDHDHEWEESEPPPPDETPPPDTDPVDEVAIQPDQVLQATPGEGVGVFVEYMTGGKWRIWTACDTFTSKQVCSFQIFAYAGASKELQYASEQIEGFDTVQDLGDGTIELTADTDSDIDALVLSLEDGFPLEVEAYIDDQNAQAFVYWVSDDIIHTGAPSNPVRFMPAIAATGK